eukprot:1160064-Pelagomonas_calceolata.AAC.3
MQAVSACTTGPKPTTCTSTVKERMHRRRALASMQAVSAGTTDPKPTTCTSTHREAHALQACSCKHSYVLPHHAFPSFSSLFASQAASPSGRQFAG